MAIDIPCPALARFIFGRTQQALAKALPAVFLVDPEPLHEQPAEMRVADDAAHDVALVAQRDGQRHMIDPADGFGIEGAQAAENRALSRSKLSVDLNGRSEERRVGKECRSR